MPAPDRALKRLVANLARAGEEDIEAVLGGLERRHRTTVEDLLTSFRGERAVSIPAPVTTGSESIVIEGLSPWLVARLERRARSAVGRPGAFGELAGADAREAGLAYAMTQAAFETLQACAASMEEPEAAAPRRSSARRRLLGGRAP